MLHIRALGYVYTGLCYIYGPMLRMDSMLHIRGLHMLTLYIRVVCKNTGSTLHIRTYVTYIGCMLHIRALCYIIYTGCILYIRALCYILCYIYGPMLNMRALCYIYGLYVTYTGPMLHIRAACYIYESDYVMCSNLIARVCNMHARICNEPVYVT